MYSHDTAALYAASESSGHTYTSGYFGIPVHPGEDASAKEESDWWRIFNGIIASTDAVHYAAGEEPPRLAHLKPADLTDYAEVTVPAATEASYMKAVGHNRHVRAAVAENTRRATMRDDHQWHSATSLAAALDTALRPKAASLLFRLQKKHRDATRSTKLGTDQYDGHAFLKTMRAELAAGGSRPSKARSYEWHEEQYRVMRATKLPDGCSSQDFGDKCNLLDTHHIPYFRTLKLEAETLSEAYLAFMPAALAGDARRIADQLHELGKMNDPEEAKTRAMRAVAAAADPVAEHARLAMALGHGGRSLGTSPASPAPAYAATPANAPPAPGGTGSITEADVQRIVAAAVKGNQPPGGGGADAESRRKQKAKERSLRGRLPEGKRCKSGTCDLNHDEKYPGRPCYSDPRVAIAVPYEYANTRPGALDRLKERRATEGKRLGVTPKPVTVQPAGAAPACALGSSATGFDGLDDWGAARPATLGSAAGLHPLLGGPPIVTGTPVQCTLEELTALDDECDECPDDDGAVRNGAADAVRNGAAGYAYADAQPQMPPPPPPLPPPLPPPQPPSRWWVVRSPDGQYLDARSLTHGEWCELHGAEFDLHCHGEGAAGEIRARAALATLVAQIGAESRATSPVSAAPPVAPKSPPPAAVSEALTPPAVQPDAQTPLPPGPASPPGSFLPRRCHQAARAMIDALRPDVDSPTVIRAALKESGLSRDVCSPRIGGGGATRTRLTVINEARALFVLPPLSSVDPASVARHQAQYLARQVPLGTAVPPPASASEELTLSSDDEGDEAAPPPPGVSGSLTEAAAVAATATGEDARACAGSPGAGAATAAAAVSDSLMADAEPGEVAGDEDGLDVSGITVGAVLFEWPSREALLACGLMALLLLLTVGVVYVMGAPSSVIAASGTGMVTSGGPATGLARALARAGAGAGLIAQATLVASQNAPVQLFAGATSVAWIVHRFLEAEGWRVLLFIVRLTLALAAATARRFYRALRASPGLAAACCTGALVLFVTWLVSVTMHGVDARPTVARVQTARSIVEALPMPVSARASVTQAVRARHNVAFIGNFLSTDATHELACDLGQSDPEKLTLWDTGAAINASVGKHPVVPGSVVANTTYVSTANGLCLPPTRCTQLVEARSRSGSVCRIPLHDSVVLDTCQHTLCAGGKLALEDGYGLMVAPRDGETFLFTSFTDRSSDIPLVNVGVLVVPHSSAKPSFPISRGHIQNEATRGGGSIHQTFNHRGEVLEHMPECTHAPSTWTGALKKHDCRDCAAANATRVPMKGHAPAVSAPGDCLTLDEYHNPTPHIHGGQTHVLGTHDLYSRLDRSYLMDAKSDAAACLEGHFAWNNSLGVRYKRCHTDNAPDLCKGESAQTFRRWGVHLTTSTPYEPRQNGTQERRWRQKGDDTRVALEQSNFTLSPHGEKYWWYAWRDAEMKSWCIPFQRPDGTWTCPWQAHTGHRPNPTVYRPFGMLCYAKDYHPASKTAARGRECRVLGYSATQKGWLLLEVPSGRKLVTPHVYFCWGEFPGLKPVKAGGGLIIRHRHNNRRLRRSLHRTWACPQAQ